MSGLSFRVLRAEHAGACYGVQRALDLTLKAADAGGPVCTLGPLIHNPRVVEALAGQGIAVADSPGDIQGGSVVIRSHGVVPQVQQELVDRGLDVVDATCPHVKRAHKAAAKLAAQGYYVLVVGEAGHPEVEGISAHARAAGGQVAIVGGPDDIPQGLTQPVGVVVQTTQSRAKLDSVLQALRARGIAPEVKDTICFATQQRQEAAVSLASQVDVMLVIGGRNSSNTTRLFELCSANCPRAYHIEGPEEINPAWFEGVATVGITAGASTPEEHIAAVAQRLDALQR